MSTDGTTPADGSVIRPLKRSPSLEQLPLTDYDTGSPAQATELSIARTFQQLELRKHERRRAGTLQNVSAFWQTFWLLAVLSWWAGLFSVNVSSTGGEPAASLSLQLGVGALLGATALFLAVATVVRVAHVVKFLTYWIFAVAFLMVYVARAKDASTFRNLNSLATGFRREGLHWGLAVLIVLETLTVCVWFVRNVGFPRILAGATEQAIVRTFSIKRAPDFDQAAEGGVAFTYANPWWYFSWPRLRLSSSSSRPARMFFFNGQLLNGQPHGFGEWRDDTESGEVMRGFFNRGTPVAPFRSKLYSAGHAFEAVHVAFATARAEPFGLLSSKPARHSFGGLRFGVAACECSISGEFYSALPRCLLLRESSLAALERSSEPVKQADQTRRTRAHNAREAGLCIALLRHADEAAPLTELKVTIAHDGRSLALAGFEPVSSGAGGTSAQRVTITLAQQPVGSAALALARAQAAEQRRIEALEECSNTAPPLQEAHAAGAGASIAPALAGGKRAGVGIAALGPAHMPPPAFPVNAAEEVHHRHSLLLSPRLAVPQQRGSGHRMPAHLAPLGWQPRGGRDDGGGGRAPEVLIYIHGFNCPTEEAVKRIAQLLALGRFPPHIKPLCFSWPTASILTYFQALHSARSSEVAADLRATLRSLRESGVRDIHIMSHSMGAAVLTHAISVIEPELEPVAVGAAVATAAAAGPTHERLGSWWPRWQPQPRAAHGDGDDDTAGELEAGHGKPERDHEQLPQLRLLTVSWLNPEVFEAEDDFWGAPFAALSRVCSHITLYGDENDGALWWSEVVNRGRKSIGRLHGAPYKLGCQSGGQQHAQPPLAAVADGQQQPHAQPSVTDEVGSTEWLDIDVVDMTWLDANVHAIRHNSFGLNRMMIDDLRDVIVDRRRAAHRRSRLVRRIGNVFSFLQPPSHVVNN